MRRTSRAAGMLLLVLVGPLAMAATRSGATEGSTAAPPPCEVPDDDALAASSAETPAGYYEYEEWLASPPAQAKVKKLDDLLLKGLELSKAASMEQSLAKGLIGVVPNHYEKKLVVVVDSAQIDMAALDAKLETVNAGFGIDVIDACFDASAIDSARRVIEERAWHPLAKIATFSYGIDAGTSRIDATFGTDPASIDAGKALAEQLGSVVDLDYDGMGRASGSRTNDADPHYGGAAIRNAAGTTSCTSGFTVRRDDNGNRVSVTAGHCFANEKPVYSGDFYFGFTSGDAGYPTYDMMRIGSQYEGYAAKIWVDPCCPSVRTVVANGGNPQLNEYVCVSGAATRAVCGLRVVDTSEQFCDASGCTPNLFEATKPGEVVIRPGDSGGPVYERVGDNDAAIRGMIVAGNLSGDRDTVLAHKISTVESHLGVTLVTL